MKWIVLALVGSALCTVGDHLHATCGVLEYRHVFFWDQAWWVPPLFMGAALAAVLGCKPFLDWGKRTGEVRRPDARQLLADGLGFFAAYAYTSFAAHDHPNVTLAVLVIAFIVRVLGERRPTWLVASCVALAAGGVLTEFAVSSTGGFHYLHPDFLATPRWLAGIYLHAGLIAGELAILML